MLIYKYLKCILSFEPFFREFHAIVDDAKLVYDLRRTLGKQVVDVDILATTMKELDKTGDDQITFDQVESVLRTLCIQLDKMVMTRWMKAARTAGPTFCSIARLVNLLSKAANPVHKIFTAGGIFCLLAASLIQCY